MKEKYRENDLIMDTYSISSLIAVMYDYAQTRSKLSILKS